MGGGPDSRCIGHVYGADGAVHGTIRTVHSSSQDHHPIHKLGAENHMLRLNI
jgi:hypothetical protein